LNILSLLLIEDCFDLTIDLIFEESINDISNDCEITSLASIPSLILTKSL